MQQLRERPRLGGMTAALRSCKAYSYIGSRHAPDGGTEGRAATSLRAMGTDRDAVGRPPQYGRSLIAQVRAIPTVVFAMEVRVLICADFPRDIPQKVPSVAHPCATRLLRLGM